ncbi:integrase [Catenulispora sp. EB89]|uniref:tyrosine-type recombinase/integrase n=1 Tax=Catenulispora sp. EB89 TaxID=3156257 RepID=UPI0035198BF9
MPEPYDRWHKTHPKPGEKPCSAHDKVPSAKHGRGKRWAARWVDPDGEPQESLFDRRPDAVQHLNKVAAALDAGTYIAPRNGLVLLESVAQRWLDSRNFKSPRTYAQYESRINNHIIDVLGKLRLCDIKPSTIVAWINGRREYGLDETTIGLVLAHLAAIMESALDDELIAKNPCRAKSVRDVKPKRSKRPARKAPLSGRQLEALRENLPDRYKTLVDVTRGLGMRQGEVFAFSPDDIDWAKKVVHVRRQFAWDRGTMVFAPPKCSDLDEERDRFVPAADEVLFAIMAHADAFPPVEVTLPWKTRDGELRTTVVFFTSREGKPLNKNYINWVWKGGLEQAGIIKALNDKPIGRGRKWEPCRDKMMHAGRHDYATQRLGEGMDIFTLSVRLGHADPAYTLRKYTHEPETDYEVERQRIDETLRATRSRASDFDTPSAWDPGWLH